MATLPLASATLTTTPPSPARFHPSGRKWRFGERDRYIHFTAKHLYTIVGAFRAHLSDRPERDLCVIHVEYQGEDLSLYWVLDARRQAYILDCSSDTPLGARIKRDLLENYYNLREQGVHAVHARCKNIIKDFPEAVVYAELPDYLVDPSRNLTTARVGMGIGEV